MPKIWLGSSDLDLFSMSLETKYYIFPNKVIFQSTGWMFAKHPRIYHWYKPNSLTLKAPNKIATDDTLIFLLWSFTVNKAWCFMWILCLAEDSHEMYYFLWKTFKKYLWMSSAAVVIGVLRVNRLVDFFPSFKVPGWFKCYPFPRNYLSASCLLIGRCLPNLIE